MTTDKAESRIPQEIVVAIRFFMKLIEIVESGMMKLEGVFADKEVVPLLEEQRNVMRGHYGKYVKYFMTVVLQGKVPVDIAVPLLYTNPFYTLRRVRNMWIVADAVSESRNTLQWAKDFWAGLCDRAEKIAPPPNVEAQGDDILEMIASLHGGGGSGELRLAIEDVRAWISYEREDKEVETGGAQQLPPEPPRPKSLVEMLGLKK